MNETIVTESPSRAGETRASLRSGSPPNWGLIGYSLVIAALLAGWLLRGEELVDPNEGLGYWLGIAGGSLMLVLVFYPSIKKSKLMHRLGWGRHWFRVHIIFGLIGPLMILYHSNFSVDAINSKVALYSMLVVAISGVVGRYIYARIHRGLSGNKLHVEDLRAEISGAMEKSSGLASILPGFAKELHAVSAEVLGDKYTGTLGVHRSLAWSIKHHYIRIKLGFMINREIKARAKQNPSVQAKQRELRVAARRYMNRQVRVLRRVAQLSFYERVFSIWHLLHMPLFILMVISASVHVLAVHMF